MKKLVLAVALLAAGCGAYPDTNLPLPASASAGPYAPAANAITGAAAAFSNPAAIAGRPEQAAVAIMQLEWLAETVPRDLQFSNYSTLTGPALMAARYEVRAAAGIAQDAPSATVIAALDRAAPALARGDAAAAAAALAPPVFAPGATARLARLPYLPQANSATRRVQHELEFGRDDLEIGRLGFGRSNWALGPRTGGRPARG